MQAVTNKVSPLAKKKRSAAIKNGTLIALVAIIVIVAIAAAVFSITSHPSVHYISAQSKFTLPIYGTYYLKLPDNSNTYVLSLQNSSKAGALLYITGLPILDKPILVLYVAYGSGVNININGLQPADARISLNASNSSAATFEVEPIDESLGTVATKLPMITPSGFVEQALYTGNVSIITTTTTTTSTTTSLKTTTISSGIPVAQIMALINNTAFGTLMNNYKALYIKDTVCSAGVYNATYYKYYSVYPSGPNSFANMSILTPRNISISIAPAGGGDYIINYSTVSLSKTATGLAISATLNASKGIILGVQFSGIFNGLNYTEINAAYQFQNSISNYCGAYIPYTPTA